MYIEIPLGDLVTACQEAHGRLPFPFADCTTTNVEQAPDHHPDLASALQVLLAPHQLVYAVTASPNGDLSRTAAIEGATRGCVALTVRGDMAHLTDVGPTDLVRSVVDAVGRHGVLDTEALFDRPPTVPRNCFGSDDHAVTAERLRAGRIPESQVQAWLAAGQPRWSGLLGAVDFAGDAPRHVQRSVGWRTYSGGSLLLVEPPVHGRRREVFEVQALTQRSLARAAIDLVSSLHLQ